MAVEIERKFLVVGAGWRDLAGPGLQIVDYLIARFDGGKLRIRFCNDEATLTVKGPRRGFSRSEYHMPISKDDAQLMIGEFSHGPGLEKRRHEVNVHGLNWQIDVYAGVLEGFVTADVELTTENHDVILPDWAGREITGDRKFGSGRLADAVNKGRLAAEAIIIACEEEQARSAADQ